jgi:putative acetyltransferase
MYIRKTDDADKPVILNVERKAFCRNEESELVENLLNDPTAKPLLSLLAFKNKKPAGHILFTRARINDSPYKIMLLAPLAVIPEYQKQGIGKGLIKKGLEILKDSGTALVFVLGHPEYYPLCGFKPAGKLGFDAPYPVPDKHAEAWMVQELKHGVVEKASGKVLCADVLNRPEYWRE